MTHEREPRVAVTLAPIEFSLVPQNLTSSSAVPLPRHSNLNSPPPPTTTTTTSLHLHGTSSTQSPYSKATVPRSFSTNPLPRPRPAPPCTSSGSCIHNILTHHIESARGTQVTGGQSNWEQRATEAAMLSGWNGTHRLTIDAHDGKLDSRERPGRCRIRRGVCGVPSEIISTPLDDPSTSPHQRSIVGISEITKG